MDLFKKLNNHPELIILVLMIMIIAMLIIPLPTYLIDLLIGINMVLSILIFLGTFYIDRIISFSSFPSLLLITTLFRLSLSISTSRLILLEADAGEIITSFGNFVIGDSLAVGFVVFSIVTIVQFIVITKGSERVAEVAARFSLDGMPGKQMSIDADLRAGIIDAEQAKNKRSLLERESQLYGSFDGAMKFIKGDAIANIIIVFVNIIGGLSVGIVKNGLDFSTALSVYTILTVGDGLVSQIPALLVAISAGFIVTRVNGDTDNMGKNIVSQLMSNHFVILVTGILTIALGFLPGFPLIVFLGIFIGLCIYYYFKFIKTIPANNLHVASDESDNISTNVQGMPDAANGEYGSTLGIIENLDLVITETVPLVLLASKSTVRILLKSRVCERIRSQFFLDYGIHLPEILIREGKHSNETDITLLVNEIRADLFVIKFNMVRLIDFNEDVISSLGITTDVVVRNNENYHWIRKEAADNISTLGYRTCSAIDELYSCMSVYLSHNIQEYFGIQETKKMLDVLEQKYPELLREVLRYITIQRISEVIQRLIKERISVRNMRLIMESLASWAPKEKDIIVIVEHVRGALGRYICHKFSTSGAIKAVTLSKDLEDVFRAGIRPTSTGTYLNLEPSDADYVSDQFQTGMQDLNSATRDIVLIASIDVRRFIKCFLEQIYPELEVISYGELTDAISLQVIKTIG